MTRRLPFPYLLLSLDCSILPLIRTLYSESWARMCQVPFLKSSVWRDRGLNPLGQCVYLYLYDFICHYINHTVRYINWISYVCIFFNISMKLCSIHGEDQLKGANISLMSIPNHTDTDKFLYKFIYIYIYICTHPHKHPPTSIRMYVCMYVCMYVYVCI